MNFILSFIKKLVPVFVIIVGGGMLVYAAAPTGGYTPGATLNPDCTPGSVDCIVKTNSLGTTDAQDLIFKTNNNEQLRITQTGRFLSAGQNPTGSTSFGIGVSNETVTGINNAMFGGLNGRFLTTGQFNSSFGLSAFRTATTASENASFGYFSMKNLTIGNGNTGFGTRTFELTTTGNYNTAIGYAALQLLGTGSNNIAIGKNTNVPNGNADNQMNIGNLIYGTGMSGSLAGNIGIGTMTPGYKMQISNNGNSGNLFAVGISDNEKFLEVGSDDNIRIGDIDGVYDGTFLTVDIPNDKFIFTNGNVGIGNVNPGYLFHVGSSAITSGTSVARFENAGGTCTVTPDTAGGITCTSDIRFKKDITDVSNTDILSKITSLDIKSYRMSADTNSSEKQIGFIAQNMETVFPHLVMTDTDGRKAVSYAGMTPVIVAAIKELNLKLDKSILVSGNSDTAGFFDALKTWLGNTANGLDKLFAREIETEKLCVKKSNGTSICINGDQLDDLLSNTSLESTGSIADNSGSIGDITGGNAGGDTTSGSAGTTPDTTDTVIPASDTSGSSDMVSTPATDTSDTTTVSETVPIE